MAALLKGTCICLPHSRYMAAAFLVIQLNCHIMATPLPCIWVMASPLHARFATGLWLPHCRLFAAVLWLPMAIYMAVPSRYLVGCSHAGHLLLYYGCPFKIHGCPLAGYSLPHVSCPFNIHDCPIAGCLSATLWLPHAGYLPATYIMTAPFKVHVIYKYMISSNYSQVIYCEM